MDTHESSPCAACRFFLIGLRLIQFILLFVQQPRPYDAGSTHHLIDRSSDLSFPSDHATTIVAITAVFLFHELTPRRVAFVAVAILVSLSRIYVGGHYASDVSAVP